MKLYYRMIGYIKPYVSLIIATLFLSLFIVTAESLSLWFAGTLIRTLFIPETASLIKPVFSLSTINDWLKYQTFV
ncbi:MAG TPA: hypothetical protein VF335_06870, partial [Chitinivibrionales bacterium]